MKKFLCIIGFHSWKQIDFKIGERFYENSFVCNRCPKQLVVYKNKKTGDVTWAHI